MKRFFLEEEGTTTVFMSLILPFILFYMLWTVSVWQGVYINNQMKSVVDFAVLDGATTGTAYKNTMTGHNIETSSYTSCTIPKPNDTHFSDINESNNFLGSPITSNSQKGYYVLYKSITKNAKNTLPTDIYNQIIAQLPNKAYKMYTTKSEVNYQNKGIMHLKLSNLTYRKLGGFSHSQWTFTVESSARCRV